MKKILGFLICLPILTGCAALKEQTGEYVAEAVSMKMAKEIDLILGKRGLSIDEIKKVTDVDNDGLIDKPEVVETIKSMAKDFALLEAKTFLEGKQGELLSKGDLDSKSGEYLSWLLTMIIGYLGKQVYSAKQDGKRDQRIAVIEKLVHKDLDGDGIIGAPPAAEPISV